MRCKGCDYPLWNLRSRECPECGLAFRPSEFEFTLNAVRFCCPGCGQEYYGTGAKGHLVPESFVCVSCARPITMDECVLLPTAGVQEEQTKVDEMPWFDRGKRGLIPAWFATVGRSMIAPGRLMDTIAEGAPSGFVFGTITTFLIACLGILPIFVLGGVFGAAMGGGGGARTMNVLSSMAGGAAGTLVGALVGAAILLAAWVALAHLILHVTGGTAHPMKRTCQAISYSAGANILCGIPCLSVYFGWLFVIWWFVSAAIMLARAQRVSGLRAAAAVLLPPGLLAVGMGAWFGFLIWGATTGLSRTTIIPAPAAAPIRTPEASARALLTAMKGYAQTNHGAWPDHPSALVTLSLVSESDFYPLSAAAPVPGGPWTETYLVARVGDYVWTYFGTDDVSSDPRLWVFVQAPHPAAPMRSTPEGLVRAGTIGGEVLTFANPEEFAAALVAQNDLRAKVGLPPLPHPDTVPPDAAISR